MISAGSKEREGDALERQTADPWRHHSKCHTLLGAKFGGRIRETPHCRLQVPQDLDFFKSKGTCLQSQRLK